MNQDFEIAGKITDTQIIAVGRRIRELAILEKRFGRGRWRKLKGVATVSLSNGTIRLAEVHWYEAHGIGRVRMKIDTWTNAMGNQNTAARFVICINAGGYVDDLKVRTVYQLLPDAAAAKSDYIRIIDETGEDYLYPANLFVPIELPSEAEKLLLTAS